ncbi:hypothetical protein MHU86_19400 [Fragilaria crotonensis]|nr:hypothetical protein MHU86_19400 [Fragilaria crotonensis]
MTAAAAHNKGYPYACEINVSFPTAASASRTKNVLIVDQELGNRVVKTMDVLSTDPRTLRISFQATEAKMLRVAVSGFSII